MKLGTFFSGIGAVEKALKNIDIEYDLQFFSEIDKYAIKSYTAIHNETEDKNVGDISNLKGEDLPYCDIWFGGFPCQDISVAGKLAGWEENTRSSLGWEMIRLDMNILKRFTLWIAQYNERCTYEGRFAIWQHSSSGRKDGINGKVDLNIMYEDIIQGSAKTAEIKKPEAVKPAQEAQPKEKVTIYTVKSGDTLFKIGQKYGVNWKRIYEDNKNIIGNNPDLIYPGQKYKIYK